MKLANPRLASRPAEKRKNGLTTKAGRRARGQGEDRVKMRAQMA